MSLRVTMPEMAPASVTSTAGVAFDSTFWTDSTAWED